MCRQLREEIPIANDVMTTVKHCEKSGASAEYRRQKSSYQRAHKFRNDIDAEKETKTPIDAARSLTLFVAKDLALIAVGKMQKEG